MLFEKEFSQSLGHLNMDDPIEVKLYNERFGYTVGVQKLRNETVMVQNTAAFFLL